jgi:hypothetical protein
MRYSADLVPETARDPPLGRVDHVCCDPDQAGGQGVTLNDRSTALQEMGDTP